MTKLRRLTIAVVIILVLSLVYIGINWIKPVSAQTQAPGQTRYKTVEQKVTQNVWDLINKTTGAVLCEVIIDRSGEPSQQDALNTCPNIITSATPAPLTQASFFKNTFWNFVITREFNQTVKIPIPDIVVNISIPSGPVQKPYLVIMAYEPVKEYSIISIQGSIAQSQFICDGNQCNIPVDQSIQLKFFANSSLGDSSVEVTANVDVILRPDGYYVSLVTLSPFSIFDDTCAKIWGSNVYTVPAWANFPKLPDLLNTAKSLHYLASRLIFTGIVNAKDCIGQGLFEDGSPNACGLERASTVMTEWQNQFDPFIWASGQKNGIPPKLIKTLIEKESQFWPGNSRTFLDEFGLAQMNEVGADVALRWNSDLFKQTCTGLLSECGPTYASLPSWQQAMVRGKLMDFVNSDCPTCINGMDLSTTNASIDVFTQVIKSNCSQASFIMKDNVVQAGYGDMWKFTLASFHSGYKCLNDAIVATKKAGREINWANVSQSFDCPGAAPYVDDVWTNLENFDKFVKPYVNVSQPLHLPTFVPTATPLPSPTPALSQNTIRVFVYLVFERKPFPENTVWVDSVPVEVKLSNGVTISQVIKNGQTVFDMSIYPVGSLVMVNLPTLYRSQSIQLTPKGEILVTFRLVQPQLPLTLP
jgi:hypothetical protein